MAEFKLIFKTELEDEKALVRLKKGVEDGKLGPLNVDPDSLKIKNEIEGESMHLQQSITHKSQLNATTSNHSLIVFFFFRSLIIVFFFAFW